VLPKVTMLTSVKYISLYEVIDIVAAYLFRLAMPVDRALCEVNNFTLHSARSTGIAGRNKYAATISITSYNVICNRTQYCNFGEAQAESNLTMIYVNRNMLKQLL